MLIHSSFPFRSPCLSISRLEDPTGVKVNPCPVRDYIIFITDLPPGMVTLRIYKHYGLFWVKPDSPSPSSVPKLTSSFIHLVKAYRNSVNLPITISIGPYQTRKFGPLYSIHLKHKKGDIVKVMGSSSFTIL